MISKFEQLLEETYKQITENTFPGAKDVKMPWKQTPNQELWSNLHRQLKDLADSNKPLEVKRKEEKEIINKLQEIVDTDPKFKDEYVSKPMY